MFVRLRLARQAVLRTSNRAAAQLSTDEFETGNRPEVHDPFKSVYPDLPNNPGHNVTANSILQKFAPPIEFDERFLQRAKDALTEADKEGKTLEEIEKLERDMAIYIKQTELDKVEQTRLREDMGSFRESMESHKINYGPYYQRQLIDRLEWVSQNQPRRPIITDRSSSVYPYKFYGDVTEWGGLDKVTNICKSNHAIRNTRHVHYHTPTGKMYLRRYYHKERANLLRNQFLSGEALVRACPSAVQPYLRLARYDKPIGYQLLFVPCVLSMLAGTPYGALPPAEIFAIFAAGTLLTRGAGCTINDIWDRDLDAQVERCKNRPLPAGDVTLLQAQAFFVAQMSAAFGLLCLLNPTTFFLGLAAPIPIMMYPLVKRMGLPEMFKYSMYSYAFKPQLFLGLTFNWGAFMGYSAMTDSINPWVQVPLYAACVLWTLNYDTAYALQDLADDKKLGLNTSADFSHLLPKRHRNNPNKAFRNHRSRQEIMIYQKMAQRSYINFTTMFVAFIMTYFCIQLENTGVIENGESLFWPFLWIACLQWIWFHLGLKNNIGGEKAKWAAYFVRQKWVGLAWIALVLAQHGIQKQWACYDDTGKRIYPVREQIKELIPASVLSNPSLD